MKKLCKKLFLMIVLFIIPCNFANANQVPLADMGAYKFVERINTIGMQFKDPIKLVNLHQKDMKKHSPNPNNMTRKYDTYVATFNTGNIFFLCDQKGYVCGIGIVTSQDNYSTKENTQLTRIVGQILLNDKNRFSELINNHKCWYNDRWFFWALNTKRNVYISLFLAYDS